MPTVKTAISIDTGIYKKVERLSKKLHISRSQFFSQAAQYMLDRNENIELLKKINTAYAALPEDDVDKVHRRQEKRYHAKRNMKQW